LLRSIAYTHHQRAEPNRQGRRRHDVFSNQDFEAAVNPGCPLPDGTVAVAATFATSGSVDLILDVNGYFLP
jgi:hypothetical protein